MFDIAQGPRRADAEILSRASTNVQVKQSKQPTSIQNIILTRIILFISL